jgi:hypothetical protein
VNCIIVLHRVIWFAYYPCTFRSIQNLAWCLLNLLCVCVFVCVRVYPKKSSRMAVWIFMKFDIREFNEELLSDLQLYLDLTVLTTTLYEDLHAFLCVNNRHGFPFSPRTWISHAFLLFMHPFPMLAWIICIVLCYQI